MNVLICGYYGGSNFGDQAILQTFIKFFKELKVNAKITSLNHHSPPLYTDQKLANLPAPLFNRYWYKHTLPYYFKRIKEQDLIIIGGGQLLQDSSTWKTIATYMLIASIGKICNKKVVYVGVGASPVQGIFPRYVLKKITRLVDLVITRDIESKHILKDLTKRNDMHAGTDLVLNLIPLSLKKIRLPEKRKIGISLREYNFPLEKKEEIIAFINNVGRSHQVYLIATEEDEKLLKQITDKVYEDIKVLIVKFNTVQEYLTLIKKMDLMIGMRFHFLVVATLYLKPCFGFAYDPKVLRFCKKYGQKWCSMEDIRSKTLNDFVHQSSSNDKLSLLAKNVLKDQETNLKNFRKVLSHEPGTLAFFSRVQCWWILLLLHIRLFFDLFLRFFTRHVFKFS